LKLDLRRGNYAVFAEEKVRTCLYRPFCRRHLFFDRILNEEVYRLPRVFPTPEAENLAIAVSDIGFRASGFSCMTASVLVDIHLCAGVDAHQCYPFYVYDEDGGNRRENITDWALKHFRQHYRNKKITKWDIFYYVYGILHHPGYRERYAENLKRDLPRIPMAPDFRAFAKAGKELARLHMDYEKLGPWPLEWIESPDVPLSYRVEDKMRLSKDKGSLKVNDSLTLAGIPSEVFKYRLGNRSALEWVIDQYRVSRDEHGIIASDPNRADDEQYIVRLVGQVVTVSLETVKIVGRLPPLAL
jgi:predicted helicase